MLRARLTSKGQVTIPVAVRRKLNLQPGDELLFDLSPDGEVKVRALRRKRLTELYASLPDKRPYPGKTPGWPGRYWVKGKKGNGLFVG